MGDRDPDRAPAGAAPHIDGGELTEAAPLTARHARVRASWKDALGSHTMTVSTRCVLGSSAQAGVMISDRAISRFHAELEPRPDGMWVRDLGSRNGMFVNGVFTALARLPAVAKLHLGNTVVEVHEDRHDEIKLWPRSEFGSLQGASAPMRELFGQLARVAASEAPVLIHGETGTGKELVAREVHASSSRAKRPFVIVDCGALPEALLEGELFGHTRGAFTGAVRAREGAFEAADGGTLFLDEVGELPLAVQPKLLRVLEARTVRRLGENEHRPVDVRVLAATHRDLRSMVNARTFREDLFFRLAVLPIVVPPLRDRGDDVVMLADRFANDPSLLDVETMRQLTQRPWPGNVRELRNFIERLRAFGVADHEGASTSADSVSLVSATATAMDVRAAVPANLPEIDSTAGFREFRERWNAFGERRYLEALLARTGDNVALAATAASLERTYMYRLLRKHGL